MNKEAKVNNPPFPKNYNPEFLVIDHGEGVHLFDIKGNKYLDFGSGIAVNALGYGREDLAELAATQMNKVIHVSNLFTTQPALDFAEKLTASGDFQAVHFGNSGTEANEAAIKYARLYSLRTKGEGNHHIISFENGFHGRTMGALSATAKEKYKAPFYPLPEGFSHLPYNDVDALKKAVGKSCSAIMVEVVQGEGGVNVLGDEMAEALNEVCAEYNILMIVDEVQTGMGRTGSLFAYQKAGLKADIVTLSKPIAGGLPLSATLIPEKVNSLIKPGEHGTTFGGGPVTTAIASYIWDIISDEDFLKDIEFKGAVFHAMLEEAAGNLDMVEGIRGRGLLQGLVLKEGKAGLIPEILNECALKGLLILSSGTSVIRMAPPLVINEDELREGVDILIDVIKELS